jgi:hypothetical protein
METFEPPKYLTSLIAAVNEGAKSAQTGALAFSLVGLYLLATAFSTSDEDLLLEHTMLVSQIGVQVPAIFSFAIAPAVFLFLHAYTLIRYDMLAVNLRAFRTELPTSVPEEANRERCLQLLANVEFVQLRAAPRISILHNWPYRLVAWLVLAGFPVATLIAVQISSLRYQSEKVNLTQQVCIALDLILLAWFFHRERERARRLGYNSRFQKGRYFLPGLLAAVAFCLDWLYLSVPARGETVLDGGVNGVKWSEAYRQPLDFVLCPALHWGCRYLTPKSRTLVVQVWNNQALVDLRTQPQGDVQKPLAAIEGVSFRDRTLRFARFDSTELYSVNLVRADLTGVHLLEASLVGGNLIGADLTGALLLRANLTAANLSGADLTGAILFGANLSGAQLSEPGVDRTFNLQMVKVTQPQLDQACGDKATKLPPGLTIHPCADPSSPGK